MRDERRSVELIGTYFREGPAKSGAAVIDDRTWTDLDMDQVFAAVDRTRSSVGQGVLYALLRLPLTDSRSVAERAARIEALRKDNVTRARATAVLRRLGVERESEVYKFLVTQKKEISDRRRWLYLGLSVLPLPAALLAAFTGLPGILLVAASLIVNLVLHYRFKAVVAAESASYEYLHRLLGAAARLGRVRGEGLGAQAAELRTAAAAFAGLRRRTAALITPSGVSGDIVSLLLEYVRQLFLQEVTTYHFVHNEIMRRRAEISVLYRLVGEVDALVSLASLRKERPDLVIPRIVDGAMSILADEMVHPLLEAAVPNSVRMDARGLLITGSNMSGKSTFLRTLGVNQLLATTAGFAFARRWEAGPLLVMTSITNRDSLLDAESHYLVEARRLLALLEAGRGEVPGLFIIDEILSGTNSEERIAASIRILRHLAGLHCRVVAATHDRPIAAALEGAYENAHFTHRVDGEGLEFDYRLHPGVVEAGNAFRLLALLGYPKEILDDGSARG